MKQRDVVEAYDADGAFRIGRTDAQTFAIDGTTLNEPKMQAAAVAPRNAGSPAVQIIVTATAGVLVLGLLTRSYGPCSPASPRTVP